MKIIVKDCYDLRQRIIKKGFSIRAFAREVEIDEGYANQIVTGNRNPGPDKAKKISDFLGTSFEEIFDLQ